MLKLILFIILSTTVKDSKQTLVKLWMSSQFTDYINFLIQYFYLKRLIPIFTFSASLETCLSQQLAQAAHRA